MAEARPPALDEKRAGGCRGGDGQRGEGLRAALPSLPAAVGSGPSGTVSIPLCQHDMGSHSSRPEPERGLIIGPPRVWSAHPQAFGDDFCSIQAMVQTVIRSFFFFMYY